MCDLNLSWGGVLDFRVQDLLAFLMMVQIANPSDWYQIKLKLYVFGQLRIFG